MWGVRRHELVPELSCTFGFVVLRSLTLVRPKSLTVHPDSHPPRQRDGLMEQFPDFARDKDGRNDTSKWYRIPGHR